MKNKKIYIFFLVLIGIIILSNLSSDEDDTADLNTHRDNEEIEPPNSDLSFDFSDENDHSNGGFRTCDTSGSGGSGPTYNITINCSDISVYIQIVGMDYITPGGNETYALEAGIYELSSALTYYFADFEVTSSGTVQYDPTLEGTILTGAGTSVLTIVGYPITLDATDVDQKVNIGPWASAQSLDWTLPGESNTYRLIADPYRDYLLYCGDVYSFASFAVEPSGVITYDESHVGVITGNETSIVMPVGHIITINTTDVNQKIGLGYWGSEFFLGWTDPGNTTTYKIVANTERNYKLFAPFVHDFASFAVEPSGVITYDESQVGMLEGNETSTVTPVSHSITINAGEVDHDIALLPWTSPDFLGWTESGTNRTYKVIANTYRPYLLYSPIVYSFSKFYVNPLGLVFYDESQVGIIKGNNTSILTPVGHPITVKATETTKNCSIGWDLGDVEPGQIKTFKIVANEISHSYPVYIESTPVGSLNVYPNASCSPNEIPTSFGTIFIEYGYPGPPWYLSYGIIINGNQEWADLAAAEEWCTGSGTLEDPYILENLIIDVQGTGSCITVLFTDVYFIIRHCTCTNSGSDIQDAGIKLYNVDNGKLVYNNCSSNNRHGIYITVCENINITENILSNNLGNGIRLYLACKNNIIFNNTIENNADKQIYLHSSCDNNLILMNDIVGADNDGIYIYHSDFNIISENSIAITGLFDYGIYLWNSHNTNILDNDEIGGIRIRSSANTTIARNYIRDGIVWEDGATNSIVTENDMLLLNQVGCGLKCDVTCYNNLIYNNNITVAGATIQDDGTNNQWDNGIIGNYWSDYSGQDLNDDGIGDTPYYISGSAGSQDNYPIWDDGPDDITPPSTSITIDGILGMSNWYLSDVTITLIATDASGVSFTKYSFDGTTWITYTNPFIISTEGITTVYYYSVDYAGNIEDLNTAQIKIDKTAPITQLEIGDHFVDGEGNIFITSDTEFSILATEEISGLDCIKYTINGAPWSAYIEPFTLEGIDGVYIIEYYGIDMAGNTENVNSLTVNLASLDIDSFVSRGESNPITYFDVIFTKDKSSGGYKLVATNPGQVFYHIDFVNNWPTSIDSLVIEAIIPSDFVLKGSNPITVYLNGMDITDQCIIDGTVINLSDIPTGGVITVIIHLDYALKESIYPSLEDFGLKGYVFSVISSGVSGDSLIINDGLVGTSQSSVTFIANQKKTTAMAGYVTDVNGNPIVGALIELYDNYGNLIGTTITDENGFYYFIDIEEGDYEVHLLYESYIDVKVATAFKDELTEIDFSIPN